MIPNDASGDENIMTCNENEILEKGKLLIAVVLSPSSPS
jgi:hypothetical protein